LAAGSLVDFEAARRALSPAASAHWFATVSLPDGSTYLRWAELFEFLVASDGKKILYRCLDRATEDAFTVYLLGQVLSYPLVARGIEPLHGTVVSVDGAALALVGNCGFGKSTLAAALLARGHAVLTDDLVVLHESRERWMVTPGIPRLKLFPAIASALLGVEGGPPMNHGTPKLVVPLDPQQSSRRARPLRALYVLSDPGEPPAASSPGVRIDPLGAADALIEVIRAAFNLVVRTRERLATQFAFATRLAAEIPVRRLTYPRELALLPHVCDTLLEDVRRGPAPATGGRSLPR
jgi:hypothetical protein